LVHAMGDRIQTPLVELDGGSQGVFHCLRVRLEVELSVLVVQAIVLVHPLVLSRWHVLEETSLGFVRLEPGLVEDGKTGDESFQSEELALAVEPVSTVRDWSWVVEGDFVFVSTTVQDEVVALFVAV